MPDRLKILFLTNRSPYPIKDGQSRRTYNILKGLAHRHEVSLVSLTETPEETLPESIAELMSFCEKVDLVPAPSKTLSFPMVLRLVRSLFSMEPYTVWRHYSRPYADRVRAWLERVHFDIVHCDILPLAYCVRHVGGPLRVLTDHDVSYLKARRLAAQARNPLRKLFLRIESLKLRRLESAIFEELDLGIAVSDLDRQHLKDLCPRGRFAVVENGVDVRVFVPNPGAVEPDTLVWLGGFRQQANCDAVRYFLESIYPLIKRERRTVKFHVVGDGIPGWLSALAANDASVVLTGFVDDPLPYLQRSAVFVAPILSGGGTKLKVLEAMAAGKAIVSTSIGVEGIHGDDNVHFLVADTPHAFASRAIALLDDGAMRNRLEENARKRAIETYDWDAICESMSSIYQDARKAVTERSPIPLSSPVSALRRGPRQ